jgi:hypothetical protein
MLASDRAHPGIAVQSIHEAEFQGDAMMARERRAAVADKQAKALNLVRVAVLLIGAFIFGGPALAQAPDPCPGGQLPAGTGQDIVINHPCTVRMGTYNYGNVNIIAKGSLVFEENVRGEKIDFWAKSILVENGGSLLTRATGVVSPYSEQFGIFGGVLTIHLYGADQGLKGTGVTCQSPANDPNGNPSRVGQCGIPNSIWDTNGNSKVSLPGQKNPDYFYQYSPLPFDHGEVDNKIGYFGYKVIAVSYGGTLKLFGSKGVSGDDLIETASGTSWVRLRGTITPGATQLIVRPITWQAGDHIVVTTTDYLPNHSEELLICKIEEIGMAAKITFTTDLTADVKTTCPAKGVKWTHNGEQYSLARLPSRLNIGKATAETRAAVGLLTRSVRIVSEGDAFGNCFPPSAKDPIKGCSIDDPRKNYYFGGHTIARQGFLSFQVEGVEFRQLGQGGKLGHYPIHFHLARHTPPDTYVRDSSINESMTRWITVHGTQDLTIQRNVGYRSIGHGYYLEDAVETDNKFYSNLGVFARAAVKNADNPREVPGILASPDENHDVRFGSDKDMPSVFWITNGWNDFEGNMAAGAGMCGVCYWEAPAGISGPSQRQTWESYASGQTPTRVGSSPLKSFDHNFCTSAMTSFQTVGYTQSCPGVGANLTVAPVVNPYAPPSNASPPDCGPGTKYPMCPDDYYPKIDNGQLNQATKCPDTGPCDDTTAVLCQNSNETNCLPTVINDYTSSFHWSQFNFSAIWLRRRWHLVSNSFVSDVQNAGLTFISGGDYTNSSAIKGLWELALQTVFVGQTQPADKAPFASSTLDWLKCDNPPPQQLYCISAANSFTLGGFTGFAVSQHMFNIYDGPGDQDSNAYLDIKKHDLGSQKPADSVYRYIPGIPMAVNPPPPESPVIPAGHCYIQNAAIAWKQPNGFYYPPGFHSRNLFFDNVDIRHYVIVPQFVTNTYVTDAGEVKRRYCPPPQGITFDGMFNGFSAIDRQTVLTDDDGSLTGYAKTISVNEDKFFTAPIEGIECQSDGDTVEGGTARMSPYDYVTTVVYPDSAQKVSPPLCGDTNWDSECSNQACFGVPFYRLYQTGSEKKGEKVPEFIRMAGMNVCQRETMTVNHGHYYVDLTASETTQSSWGKRNIFEGGKTYDFFLVHGTPRTEQTYKMYVGPGFNKDAGVKLIRANVSNAPFVINPGTGGNPSTLTTNYDGAILTVTLNLSAYANDFASAAKDLCVPKTFCDWNGSKCVGKTGVFPSLTQDERDITCSYAGKDIDCPTGGCVGFSVALPAGFVAKDQTTVNNSQLVKGLAQCFPKDDKWNVNPVAAPKGLAGACFIAPIKADFCQN